MGNAERQINLVLISNKSSRARMIHDMMQRAGIRGVIRRHLPTRKSIDFARPGNASASKPLPDLVMFDFSDPDEHATGVLREMAFGRDKVPVPVVLLTSPESLALLDEGYVDGGEAVMFSPTELASFVGKMCRDRREDFFKALKTLYQFGPILVRTPGALLQSDTGKRAIPA